MTKGPLRKITQVLIGAIDGFGRQKVRLECGHEVWCSGSATYRARCRHCAPGVSRLDGQTYSPSPPDGADMPEVEAPSRACDGGQQHD
jgi:hypothetical protein